MDRFPPDSEKRLPRVAEASPYVEAYDEAVDLYLERDLQAWGKLLTLHERVLPQAWEKSLPDWTGRIDGQRQPAMSLHVRRQG
jgi:hypothetical protein